MLIPMGRRAVGDGAPVFIVFEAGPTHTGLASAKQLARHAKKAGADAIKFQITDHKKLIHDRNLPFTYQVIDDVGQVEKITEPLYEIWERRWMANDDWRALKLYCDQIDLEFFATVFSNSDVDLVTEMGCASIKIASQDTNFQDLIEYAAQQGRPIQLDTGGSSLGEIERAVDWVRNQGNEQIVINHCPSGYPARMESIFLKMIPTLKKLFHVPVAFSDHSPGWDMDVAAVTLGAHIIEKTITLDRAQRSCEHMMSLEPSEMGKFVKTIRSIETALGSSRRILGTQERSDREAIRRSAYLARDVKAGEIVKRADFEFRRPGFGIRPHEYKRYLGSVYRTNLSCDHMLVPSDFQP